MAGLAGYGLLGLGDSCSQISALVATLGCAFVWTGLGYILQPAPGGSSPEWLAAIFNLSIPILPLPVWILLLTSVIRSVADAIAPRDRAAWIWEQ